MPTCPHCGHPDAECIVAQYWDCPNTTCKHYSEPEKDTDPGWIQLDFKDLDMAEYLCLSCKVLRLAFIDEVASGARCKCGGSLYIRGPK